MSFCDFPVICTTSPATERGYLATIHDLCMGLLEGRLGDVPAMQGEADLGEYKRGHGGRMVGRKGEVVVHLPASDGEGGRREV